MIPPLMMLLGYSLSPSQGCRQYGALSAALLPGQMMPSSTWLDKNNDAIECLLLGPCSLFAVSLVGKFLLWLLLVLLVLLLLLMIFMFCFVASCVCVCLFDLFCFCWFVGCLVGLFACLLACLFGWLVGCLLCLVVCLCVCWLVGLTKLSCLFVCLYECVCECTWVYVSVCVCVHMCVCVCVCVHVSVCWLVGFCVCLSVCLFWCLLWFWCRRCVLTALAFLSSHFVCHDNLRFVQLFCPVRFAPAPQVAQCLLPRREFRTIDHDFRPLIHFCELFDLTCYQVFHELPR